MKIVGVSNHAGCAATAPKHKPPSMRAVFIAYFLALVESLDILGNRHGVRLLTPFIFYNDYITSSFLEQVYN
jgi:hypothetical protein